LIGDIKTTLYVINIKEKTPIQTAQVPVYLF